MGLIYDVATERLYGFAGEEYFDMRAVSGGGRGRTVGTADESWSSHLSTTQENTSRHRRGGTLPGGVYVCEYLAHHPPFIGSVIHLNLKTPRNQLVLTKVGGHRDLDTFYIHGQGHKGSDGCIVPVNQKAQRARLNIAVKNYPGTTLEVINALYELPALNGLTVVPRNVA